MTGLARWALLAGLVAGLVADGAAWSTAFARGDFESSLLLLYPERTVGREMMLSLVDVTEVGEGFYRVEEGRWTGLVRGDATGLEVGDELYVRGRFVEVGVMEESWRVAAPRRGGKKLLGLLAMGLVAGLVVARVRPVAFGLALRDG